MYHLKDKTVKHVNHVGSKFGFSSHTQEGPSHLYGAMIPSVANSLSMMPTVAQAHMAEFCPEDPPTHDIEDEEETRWRAPLTANSTGDKKDATSTRLQSFSLPRKNDDDKKNATRSQDNKTGGKSGKS